MHLVKKRLQMIKKFAMNPPKHPNQVDHQPCQVARLFNRLTPTKSNHTDEVDVEVTICDISTQATSSSANTPVGTSAAHQCGHEVRSKRVTSYFMFNWRFYILFSIILCSKWGVQSATTSQSQLDLTSKWLDLTSKWVHILQFDCFCSFYIA